MQLGQIETRRRQAVSRNARPASPQQLYVLNRAGVLADYIKPGEPLTAAEADAAIKDSIRRHGDQGQVPAVT